MGGRKWTEEEDRILKDCKAMSEAVSKIARTRKAILNMASKVGKSLPKLFKDTKFFEIINTEQKAYMFGLICVRGCVFLKNEKSGLTEVSVRIGDRDLLCKLKNIIGGAIYSKTRKIEGEVYERARLKIYNKKIVDDLRNKGVTHRKKLMLPARVFNFVPKHLIRHFLRGCIDGRGDFGGGRRFYYASSSFAFIKKFYKVIKSEANIKTKAKIYTIDLNKAPLYRVLLSYLQSRKLHDYLYHDASIYLERKKLAYG